MQFAGSLPVAHRQQAEGEESERRGWCGDRNTTLIESRSRYHGGRRPSSNDSFHSPTIIPPSALDKSEYHEALSSSVNVQSHLTSSFADDGNASWYLVC